VKKLWLAALMCAFAAVPAVAQQAVAEKGKMLVASDGARLGAVYRVGADGSAQVIIDGKMVTVPASTLSVTDGKLTTNLSKSQVLAIH
jgi:hypothetical protein